MDKFDNFKQVLNSTYKEQINPNINIDDVCKDVFDGRIIKMIENMLIHIVVYDIEAESGVFQDMKNILRRYNEVGLVNWREIELVAVGDQ